MQLTEAQIFEIRRLARVELARRFAKASDILNWGKWLFPEKFELPFCQELHGYLVSILYEEFTNTEAPRNHAKTLIECFLVPLFLSVHEPQRYRHYLNVQATDDKALSINRSIKGEIEENRELRELYGDLKGERWTDEQFVLKSGVVFTAIGTGKSIRGINYRHKRPDYIIVDDLYDEKDINNPESTAGKTSWFWSSLYPARAKSRKCAIRVQGTAINKKDILEELKQQPDVISRTFKAIKNWETQEVLWPELNNFEQLMGDKRKMGSVIFLREMQNERRDDATSIIKTAWLENWEFDPADLATKIRAGHLVFVSKRLGADPSIGEKVINDFTGMALIIKTQQPDGAGNDFWIMGLWNEHASLNERVLLIDKIGKDQPTESPLNEVIIEGVAGFKDFGIEVGRRTNLPVTIVDRPKDKITNLENKSHYFENFKVHISKNISAELKEMLKEQLTNNYPSHDDVRDGLLLTIDDDSDQWAGY